MCSSTYHDKAAKLDDAYLDDLLARLNSALVEQKGGGLTRDSLRATLSAGAEPDTDPTAGGADPNRPTGAVARPQPTDSDEWQAPAALSAQYSLDYEVSDKPQPGEFWPLAPANWEEMKFTPEGAEELVLKCLMNRGSVSGREIADHIAVSFGLLSDVLGTLKARRLLVHRGAAQLGDYLYQLTDSGAETAARYATHCGYDGPAPITLQDYITSVEAQSIHKYPPTFAEIARVFNDLVLSENILDQVGQAIRAGYGFFLYGDSGNGKTSLAERVSRAFGKTIWIPRSLNIEGSIIRMFDPCNHIEVPPENKDGLYDQLKIDRRWVRIRRPTILVGGELTMDRLEIRSGIAPGVNEAPLQLKSNGGTLVIDDFGRQRMKAEDLLNRWIVPLDRRYDILNLPNGKAIQVPFDQLLIFSTNMEPHELADEAFLRRIPYKIQMVDPSEDEFRELFKREAARHGMEYDDRVVDKLIRTHYVEAGRPLRCCHARDLLRQIKHYCEFKGYPLEMATRHIDIAVRNYFGVVK
jgi:predicted ATPase with chaperone activity